MAEQINIKVGINMGSITRDLNKIKSQVSNTKVNLNPSGVNNFNKSLDKTSQSMSSIIFKVAEWTTATTILFGALRQFRESIKFMVDFDSSLTNISFTLDTTNKKLNEMADNSFDLADGLNASVKSVMEANMIFSNLNETLDTIADKTKGVIALSNISGLSISSTSNAVQGLGYQFDITSDRTQEMASSLASIAATTGVSFNESIQGMTDAVSRAGSVASEAGFEYRQFLATIATLQESTRLPGQSLAAGLQTILSRLNKVGDATAEEVSKVEGALDKINIKLRSSGTEFRNSFDVLRDLSEVYSDLSSVQQQELGFLIAGTRQRKVFSQLMGGFGDIVERTNVALESEGEIMRLNDIFAESLKGRINDFTNSLEKLYYTIQNKDTLKTLITTGVNVVDSVTEMIDKFGLLGTSLNFIIPLMGIKLVMAAKTATTALIAQKTAVLTTKETLGLFISNLFGAKAATDGLKTSLMGLKLATGGLAIALMVLPIIVTKLANAERERREQLEKTYKSIQKTNEEINTLSNLRDEYDDLLKQEKKGLSVKSELRDVQQEMARLYPELATGIDKEGKAYVDNIAIVDKQIEKNEELIKTKLQLANMDSETRIAEAQSTIDYSKSRLETITGILQGNTEKEFSGLNRRGGEQTTSTVDVRVALLKEKEALLNQLDEAEKEKAKIRDIQKQLYELTSVDEMDVLTSREKWEMKNGINTNNDDNGDVETSGGTAGAGDKTINDRYLKYTEALETLQNAEKKYNIQLKDSNITISDKIRILNKLRESIREQMEVKRSMIEAQNEEISQIKEQIKGYVQFDKSGRNIIKVNKKVTKSEEDLIKQYQSLTDAVEDTKISIIELDYAMRDNSSNILKYNTEIYEDLVDELNNSYKKDLDNYKENEQDKFDEFKRKKDARLRELDDELQQLQRLYEDVEHVESQEDLNEQLSKLEKERAMLAVDNSLWAKQRRAEIDQETLRINQEIDKNERKRDFDLKKRKIEDEKDTINEELRVAREGMEDRIKLIENKYEELLSNLENFESNWESLGETYGDALKRGLIPKLHEIEKEIGQISGEGNTNTTRSATDALIPNNSKQLLDKYKVMTNSQIQRVLDGMLSAGNTTQKEYLELQEVLAARRQYNSYHDGGFVGGKSLKPQHEEMAKLLKGELVITPTQLDSTYKNLIRGFKPSSSEKSVVIHAPFTIQNAKLENPDYDMNKFGSKWTRHTRDALQAKGVTV